MIEEKADLWGMHVDAVCVTTNGTVIDGEATMGAGCALEARNMFPGIAYELGGKIDQFGNLPFVLHSAKHVWEDERGFHPIAVVAFPVKHEVYDRANIDLIKQSAEILTVMAHTHKWQSIAIPRPGCGFGKLKWKNVKPVLEPILADSEFCTDQGCFRTRYTIVDFPDKP